MDQYLNLLREIRTRGIWKPQRAQLPDGSRPAIQSLFGAQIRFDLAQGFPLVTTRRIPYRMVVEELLWYLSGSTNNNDLLARDVPVWCEWADPATGELGPVYGKQWRRWQGPQGEVDQVARLLAGIAAVARNPEDSAGRRLLLTAWNPADLPTKAPAACHTLSQFNVTEGKLSCQLYQRSADMYLGVPFNIACYATLTHLLAHLTGLEVGEYIHTFGDAHIYENAVANVDTQLTRTPGPLPRLVLDPAIRSLEGLTVAQFKLEGYTPQAALPKVEVAV